MSPKSALQRLPAALFVALLLLLASPAISHAQAIPATGVASIRMQAWGGLGANYTGLELAKNGDIVAGFDVGFRPFAGWYPSLEIRGAYPVAKGQTVTMENLVGGIRVGRNKDRFYPYGDVEFGRGKLTFPNGYPNPAGTFTVLSNTSNVLGFGGGLDYYLSTHWGAKADFQMQRYQTPVTTSGDLYSKVFTLGVVYRIGNGGISSLRGRRFSR